MATVTDFSTVTFGTRVTQPTRTLFGMVALFGREGRGQFFLQDGTPIGPPHASLPGALAYAAKKGWEVEPVDAEELEKADTIPPEAAPTSPEVPKPSQPPAADSPEPSRERPKPPRAKKRGK